MSSAYSTLHNYAALPVYTPDVNLVAQGLQYKQQKYDRNKEALQKAFDQYSMLQVAKPIDQEYVGERIQKANELVNKYTHLDLSSDGLTQSLMRTMGTVVDENVKNAVVSTRMASSEDQDWAKNAEDNPDLYAEQNHWYAMQNRRQWLAEDKVGAKYKGGGGFIAYTDVNKSIMEGMKDLKDTYNIEYIDIIPGQNGIFRDVITGKKATSDKVKQALSSILGQKELSQLSIDAKYSFNKNGIESLRNKFTSTQESRRDELTENISSLQRSVSKGGLSPQEEEDYKTQLADKKSQLEELNSRPISEMSDELMMASYENQYISDFIGNKVDLYTYSTITDIKTYQGDKDYFNAQMKIAEFNLKKKKSSSKTTDALGLLDGGTREVSKRGLLDAEVGGEATDPLSYQYEMDEQSISNTESALGVTLTSDNVDSFLTSFSEDNVSKSIGGTIQFEGKSVPITEDNIALIESTRSSLMGTWKGVYNDDVDNFLIKEASKIAELVSATNVPGASVDMLPGELKNFNFVVTSNLDIAKGGGSVTAAYQGLDMSDPSNMFSQNKPITPKEAKMLQRGQSIIKTGDMGDYSTQLFKKYGNLIREKGDAQKALSSMTKAEQQNLKLYTAAHFISDPDSKLKKSHKDIIKTYVEKDVLNDIPVNQTSKVLDIDALVASSGGKKVQIRSGNNLELREFFNNIGRENEGVYAQGESSALGDFLNTGDFISVDRSIYPELPGMVEEVKQFQETAKKFPKNSSQNLQIQSQIRDRLQQAESYVKNVNPERGGLVSRRGSAFGGVDYNLSELSAADTEYNLGQGEVSLNPFNKDEETLIQQLNEKSANSFGGIENLVSLSAVNLSEDDPAYQKLKMKALGETGTANFAPQQNHKEIISIKPEVKDGMKTGLNIVKTPITEKQAENGYTGEMLLTDAELQEVGIKIPNIRRTQYNASFGKNAPEIDLGKGYSSADNRNYSLVVDQTQEDVLWNKNEHQEISMRAKASNSLPLIKEVMTAYQQGKFRVKLAVPEGSNTYYYTVVEPNGNQVPLVNSEIEVLSYDEVAKLKFNAKQEASSIMRMYVENLLEKGEQSALYEVTEKFNQQSFE